jgi:hypothetical protein
MNSIRERQKRYYKVFGIEIPKKSVGGGACIENIIANQERFIIKSIANPGEVRSTIKCDDKYNETKLLKIIRNNDIMQKKNVHIKNIY